MMRLVVVLLNVLCVAQVHCWPHGAPASACESLLPAHHSKQPQNSAAPYRIQVNQTVYQPGDTIEISLIGSDKTSFLGFLMEVRVMDINGKISGYMGSLTPVDGTQNVNGCGPSTLTHTDATKRSFTNLTVLWSAPSETTASFVVKATFVKSFSKFWVALTSDRVEFSPHDNTGSNVIQEETKPSTAGTKPVSAYTDSAQYLPSNTVETQSTVNVLGDSESGLCQNLSLPLRKGAACGRSNGCFVSCDSYHCDYVVSWRPTREEVEFQIVARSLGTGDQWMAIGFSYDIVMGNDSVVECVSEGGVVSVYQSFNYYYYNNRLDDPHLGLSSGEGCLSEGLFVCKFTRKKKISGDKLLEPFDISLPWIIMFANGEVRDGEKLMHLLSPKYGPWTSGVPADFKGLSSYGKGAGSGLLIKLHGCFMIIAWILSASLGILAARYYRDEWATLKPFDKSLWFLIHRTCLIVTFTLVLVGFFVIYEEADRGFGPISNGFATGKLFESVHPSLGMATVCLTFVNPVMAVFRPQTDHKYRPVFNWAHRSVGFFTFVLALFTVTFGLGMEKSGVGELGLYVMLGYAVYQCAVAVCMEISKCTQLIDKSEKSSGCKDEYQSLVGANSGSSLREDSSNWNWKTIFFVGNAIILTVVAVFLLILVTNDFTS